MKKFKLNIEMVKEFTNEGELNALAFYMMVKNKHTNSTIFNATNHKLGNNYGASRLTVKKHLHFLEQKKMVVKHGKNITMISLSKGGGPLRKYNTVTIFVKKKDTLQTIKCKLQFALFQNKAKQQSYMIDLRSSLDQNKAKVDLKAYKKYVKGRSGEKGWRYNSENVISVYSIAKMLNVSPQSASRIKQQWERLGLVKFSRRFSILGKVSTGNLRAAYAALPSGAFIAKNGVVRKSEVSSFVILSQNKPKRVKQAKLIRTTFPVLLKCA